MQTAGDGSWNKSGIDGEVTIIPQKEDWIFTPANVTVSLPDDDINFEAEYTAKTYDIGGQVG